MNTETIPPAGPTSLAARRRATPGAGLAAIGIPSRAARVAARVAAAAWIVAQSPAADADTAPTSSAACATCHGAQGEGTAAGVPRLAGQSAEYLDAALTKFKSGRRVSPVMQPIAAGLSDAQVRELSGWYAGLHAARVPSAAPPPADLVRAGRELVELGAPSNPLPPCISCHRVGGRSDNTHFPNLAGQPAAYIVNRLREFQANAREKTPEPLSMAEIAAHLDEAQVQQVAAYLSTLSTQ
jgi:cytochrome c553